MSLERRLHQHAVDKYYQKLDAGEYNIIDDPLCTFNLLEKAIEETLP